MANQAKTGGYSLIEVLVSILILGIGVIGTAHMQLSTLRMSRQATYHAVASDIAVEIADAIRMSGGKLAERAGGRSFWEMDVRLPDHPDTAPRPCYVAECDADEFAEFELHEWKRQLGSMLPDARLLICRDDAPWDAAKNKSRWDCAGSPSNDTSLVIKVGWQAADRDSSRGEDDAAPAILVAANPLPS